MRVGNSGTMRYFRLFFFIPVLILVSAETDTVSEDIAEIRKYFYPLIAMEICVLNHNMQQQKNTLPKILNKIETYFKAMSPSFDLDSKFVEKLCKLIECEYRKQVKNIVDVNQTTCADLFNLADSKKTLLLRSNNYIDARKDSMAINCKRLPMLLQACLEYNEQSYSCLSGNTLYALSSMCDGQNDCTDGSDEHRCAQKVSELLNNTVRISYELKKTLIQANCFENFNASLNKLFDEVTNMKVNNNIQGTIKALNQAKIVLSKTFCTTESPLPLIYEEVHKKSTCVCQAGQCKRPCEAICSGICERRQLLAGFECPDGAGRTVPITSLCDGFTDCDDHSDEIDCSENEVNRKFLAYGVLKKLSEDLNNLMTSQGSFFVFPQLLNLQKNLVELQRNVTAKFARESINKKIFESLENVLPMTIDTNEISLNEINHLYNMLNIFKTDLTQLLKWVGRGLGQEQQQKSGVGDDACQCHGSRCLAAECEVPCERSCAAHSSVLTYACNRAQKRIRLGALCDYTRHCPHGDDETQCATEKCQRYHFMAVLQDLKISVKYEGIFGDTLKNWIVKATGRVENALKELEMPSRLDVMKLIEVLLKELGPVYYSFFSTNVATAPKARNQDSPQIKLLTNLAAKLVNRTKSCL